MQRIGLAASKIAKGNLFLYNVFVIILSFLFSLLIFLISGLAVVLAIMILAYVLGGIMPPEFQKQWLSIMFLCLTTLAAIVGVFTFCAVFKNIKVTRSQ